MTARGRYIALEGIEGTGKSTQADLLAEHFDAKLTREPGVTPLGAHLRDLLLYSHLWPSPRAEALLFAADRAQHIAEVVAKHLADGRHVVTDRSYGSTLAYQGFGRGLPLDELRALVEYASRRPEPPPPGHDLPPLLLPDVVVLLDLPQDVASKRVRRDDDADGDQLSLWRADQSAERRGRGRKDKFEHLDHLFWERVQNGYDELCDAEPDHWVRVDATGSVDEVAARIIDAVSSHPAMQD